MEESWADYFRLTFEKKMKGRRNSTDVSLCKER
jgi:hypothetical protein